MTIRDILRRATVVVVALTATAAAAAPTPGTDASASARPGMLTHRQHHVTVRAHWENPPDTFLLSPPCTQTEYVPTTGLCHGTGAGNATITGSWQGTTTYVYGFVTTPADLTFITVLETFTGTVTGCGTGTITYQLEGTVDARGTIQDNWEIVAGLGTDELADVTGQGNQLGTYNADFTQTGDFTGRLKCGAS